MISAMVRKKPRRGLDEVEECKRNALRWWVERFTRAFHPNRI
jgi:hypothetical protein